MAVALLLAACKESAPPRVSGTPLIKSPVKDLYVSPTGEHVATLVDVGPSKDPGVPADIVLGSLMLAPVSGGSPRRIGREVPNLAGKVLYSLDGKYVACLADFSVARNTGELRLASTTGGEVQDLAGYVTFFAFSPKGDQIAYISQTDLYLRPTAGGEAKKIAPSVSMFEFSPASEGAPARLLAKKTARSGGNLLVVELDSGKVTEIARGAGTFGFSPSGDAFAFQAEGLLVPGVIKKGSSASPAKETKDAAGFYRVVGSNPPRRLTSDSVSSFRFAPSGSKIAWVTHPSGGATVGDLFLAEGDDAKPSAPADATASADEGKKIAPRVNQFVFTADGSMVLSGAYDSQSQLGTLGLLPSNGKLVELGRNVRQFTVTPKGKYLLFSQLLASKTSVTMALMSLPFGAPPDEKPRQIDTGVFGYVVDKLEDRIAYKARCIEGGKACMLFVTNLDAPAPKPVEAKPTEPKAGAPTPNDSILLAERVAAFDFASAPRGLVVVTSQHETKYSGNLLYTLGLVAAEPNAKMQVLESRMEGDFVLAGKDRDQIVYLVGEKGREGLYTTGLTPQAGAQVAKP